MISINIFNKHFLKQKLHNRVIAHMFLGTATYPKFETLIVRKLAHAHIFIWNALLKKSPHAPVFIVSTPRSGSNLLENYLVSTGHYKSVGEILSNRRVIGYEKNNRHKSIQLITFFCNFYPKKPVLIKIHLPQLHNTNLHFSNILTQYPDAKIIILYRKNVLEQFISLKKAKTTKEWRKVTPNQNTDDFTMKLHLEEYYAYKALKEAMFTDFVKELQNSNKIYISYEELTNNKEALFKRTLFPYLQIPYTATETKTVKQGVKTLPEYVSNYDWIAKKLRPKDIFIDIDLGLTKN